MSECVCVCERDIYMEMKTKGAGKGLKKQKTKIKTHTQIHEKTPIWENYLPIHKTTYTFCCRTFRCWTSSSCLS